MPKLVPNWLDILKHAWSMRLTLLSTILSLGATSWALLGGHIDPRWFAGGTFVLGALAALARVVDQGLSPKQPTQGDAP